jgi:2-phosphoglycerate kinase
MAEKDNKIESFNVRDIAPYRDEKDKATQHVAKVINRSFEETDKLIKEGKVFLLINKETEECWFEVY